MQLKYISENPGKHDPDSYEMTTAAKVFFGGVAGMIATALVHPLDVLKVRTQLYPYNCKPLDMAKYMKQCEGWKTFYSGLTAGLLRQATYTTTRLAVYNVLYDNYKRAYEKPPTVYDNVMIGIYAGLAGAVVGSPSEIALVRLIADGSKTPCYSNMECSSKEYRGTLHALRKITNEEGPRALWCGSKMTLARSVIVSTAQIGTYLQVRDILMERKIADGFLLHFYTSIVSSFFAAFLSHPIDITKTRYQAQRSGITQAEIFDSIIRERGVTCLWQGFTPYYCRMALHTFLTFVILEQISKIITK